MPREERTDVPETDGRIVSSNPGTGFSLDMPLLSSLPLSNAGVSLCPSHVVPRSMPANSSLDDGLSARCVMVNGGGDARWEEALTEFKTLHYVLCKGVFLCW